MLKTTLIPETSRSISSYAKRQLAHALKAKYPLPVTGFLVDAVVIANAAVGISYQHARRESTGRFADGHLIRTSDIIGLRLSEGRWLITTLNSTYVVVTFKQGVGRPSLMALHRLMKSGIVLTPRQLH
jgi:hypothetical protein|tara:strand:+ start:398 stop:781 length:384 start_codon:yes stop_codon:yes gene_type:complete